MDAGSLKNTLCSVFCESITVHAVPCGWAASAALEDASGDRIGFYVVEQGGKYTLEDDGAYLAHLIASGIDLERGSRQQFLDSILDSAEAYWDRDSYVISSAKLLAQEQLAAEAIRFLSVLIRIRDLEYLTREMVRSTFREDAKAAIIERFGQIATISEGSSVSRRHSDFPADIVLRPKENGRSAAIFLANNTVTFQEAELLRAEIDKEKGGHDVVIALIEDPDKIRVIGTRRFQRAQNRGLVMPIFRDDEDAALDAIERQLWSSEKRLGAG